MALTDIEPTAEDVEAINTLGKCSLCGEWLMPEVLYRIDISDCNI